MGKNEDPVLSYVYCHYSMSSKKYLIWNRDTWIQSQKKKRRRCFIYGFLSLLGILILDTRIRVVVWWLQKHDWLRGKR